MCNAIALSTALLTSDSGLGYATCCRLIDEFLATRPQKENLRLIFTTRDQQKSKATLVRLQAHVKKTISSVYGTTTHDAITTQQTARIQLQGELLDLLSLITVKQLAQKLVTAAHHIDALVLNAGIGGWSGIHWPRAIWGVLTNCIIATTWPAYKIGFVGRTVDQKSARQTQDQSSQSLLGETFTANVFGHYLLAHWLMPVLTSSTQHHAGRIIWISSIEAQAHSFDPSDFQALTSNASYESSKRLTDLLVLTSEEAATRSHVDSYLAFMPEVASKINGSAVEDDSSRVKMFVAHPGICATSIAGLPFLLHWAMVCVFYIARWLGSPWHPIESYNGAVAGVWLALAPSTVLSNLETRSVGGMDNPRGQGKSKWGSGTDRLGHERVLRTEVAGWGWAGHVGDSADGALKITAGRHRDAVDLTSKQRAEFVDLGTRCWREMEDMREYWEARLVDEART